MATKAELQKQLSTIRAGLLDFTTVGEESYFKKTGQTKLTTKEVPRYSDVYKSTFEAIKDIRFDVGSDIQTRDEEDTAFYVFDPAVQAEARTKKEIKSIEQANLDVIKQQEDIKAFLATEKEAAKTAVLSRYLTSVLNPTIQRGQINPFEWDTIDINTREGWNRWMNTPRYMKYAAPVYNDRGIPGPFFDYRIKLTPAQVAEKRKTTEAIERVRFLSSPTLQKTYAQSYASELKDLISRM